MTKLATSAAAVWATIKTVQIHGATGTCGIKED